MSKLLLPGDPAPWFRAPALRGNHAYQFDQAAGRTILMLFLGKAEWPGGADALALVARHRALFDDRAACFFGISLEPDDAAAGRIAPNMPGIRWFLDYKAEVARLYGSVLDEDGRQQYRPQWVLLDPMLRVIDRAPLGDGERIVARLRAVLAEPEPDGIAPVLMLPRIFDPALCRRLIGLYEEHGGSDSGFMRDVDGKSVGAIDHSKKRRFDYHVDDAALRRQILARIRRFLLPAIARAFQFEVTRIERYVVACYDGDGGGGYFRAHRDNTTAATAHRRFACTINLNAGEYDGGDLLFPEFGRRTYRAPTGGAAVFSCSLLHEATPVTRGKRYAYLPFLYDEGGARQREANVANVAPELAGYRAVGGGFADSGATAEAPAE